MDRVIEDREGYAPALYYCYGTYYIRGHGNWTTCVVFPEPCLLFGSSLQDFCSFPNIPRTEISAIAVVIDVHIHTYKAGAPEILHQLQWYVAV
jgi:hypothetical protein